MVKDNQDVDVSQTTSLLRQQLPELETQFKKLNEGSIKEWLDRPKDLFKLKAKKQEEVAQKGLVTTHKMFYHGKTTEAFEGIMKICKDVPSSVSLKKQLKEKEATALSSFLQFSYGVEKLLTEQFPGLQTVNHLWRMFEDLHSDIESEKLPALAKNQKIAAEIEKYGLTINEKSAKKGKKKNSEGSKGSKSKSGKEESKKRRSKSKGKKETKRTVLLKKMKSRKLNIKFHEAKATLINILKLRNLLFEGEFKQIEKAKHDPEISKLAREFEQTFDMNNEHFQGPSAIRCLEYAMVKSGEDVNYKAMTFNFSDIEVEGEGEGKKSKRSGSKKRDSKKPVSKKRNASKHKRKSKSKERREKNKANKKKDSKGSKKRDSKGSKTKSNSKLNGKSPANPAYKVGDVLKHAAQA